MADTNGGRRVALAALGAFVLALAFPAAAQDPRLSEAQRAALDWLVLADGADMKGTYGTAGAKFRTAMSPEEWTEAFAKVRAQVGGMTRRATGTAQMIDPSQSPGGGVFAVIIFRTSFANRDNSVETVTLEREGDGKWRVVGYAMQ